MARAAGPATTRAAGARGISTPLATAVVFGLLALGLVPAGHHTGLEHVGFAPMAAAQSNYGQRSIEGKVVNDRSAVVAEATIFLKNTKTRTVRSYSSTSDGSFRFAQVGMVDDYEIWAEKDDHKSAVKQISSFDSRKQLNFELKLK